jgi:hypothetical protein
MKLTRVQLALKILNASAEASFADFMKVESPQLRKKPKAKPQPKKREARK